MYGIFTYIWVIYGANVAKYTIHGSSGLVYPFVSHLPMPPLGLDRGRRCLRFVESHHLVARGTRRLALEPGEAGGGGKWWVKAVKHGKFQGWKNKCVHVHIYIYIYVFMFIYI